MGLEAGLSVASEMAAYSMAKAVTILYATLLVVQVAHVESARLLLQYDTLLAKTEAAVPSEEQPSDTIFQIPEDDPSEGVAVLSDLSGTQPFETLDDQQFQEQVPNDDTVGSYNQDDESADQEPVVLADGDLDTGVDGVGQPNDETPFQTSLAVQQDEPVFDAEFSDTALPSEEKVFEFVP